MNSDDAAAKAAAADDDDVEAAADVVVEWVWLLCMSWAKCLAASSSARARPAGEPKRLIMSRSCVRCKPSRVEKGNKADGAASKIHTRNESGRGKEKLR